MLYRAGVIGAVRELGREFFSNSDPAGRMEVLKRLAATVSQMYGKNAPPNVTLSANRPQGGRAGAASSEGITLYGKVSFVTFLHELYHWITLGHSVCTNEELARQWSVSLFIRALPGRAARCKVGIGSVVFVDTPKFRPYARIERSLAGGDDETASISANQLEDDGSDDDEDGEDI